MQLKTKLRERKKTLNPDGRFSPELNSRVARLNNQATLRNQRDLMTPGSSPRSRLRASAICTERLKRMGDDGFKAALKRSRDLSEPLLSSPLVMFIGGTSGTGQFCAHRKAKGITKLIESY